jgi:hypothetical protein
MCGVRLRQAFGHLGADIERLLRWQQPAALHDAAQRLAVHEFHDDVGATITAPDLVDGDDVRMVQRRGGSRFLLEAREPVGIGRELRREELDGHVAVEVVIPRAEHFPHAPGPDLFEELVSAEPRTGTGSQPLRAGPRRDLADGGEDLIRTKVRSGARRHGSGWASIAGHGPSATTTASVSATPSTKLWIPKKLAANPTATYQPSGDSWGDQSARLADHTTLRAAPVVRPGL